MRIKHPLDRMHNGRPAKLSYGGYVMIWEPSHPNKSFKGWQMEHRMVAEKTVGRILRSDEDVHHINGAKDDNRPENLKVMNHLDHKLLTAREVKGKRLRESEELSAYRVRFGPLEKDSQFCEKTN